MRKEIQKSKNKNKCLTGTVDCIKSQDGFGEGFSMTLDQGDQVRTIMGTFCSLFLLLITLAYAYQKLDVLLQKKDVDVLSTTKDMFWTDDD